MTDEEITIWAKAHFPAMPQARWVLESLERLAAKDNLIRQQCDRIAAQSELLSRAAAKKETLP